MERLRVAIAVTLILSGFGIEAQAKTVKVALVSNFNSISDNTLNPFTNSFRNGVALALEQAKGELKEHDLTVETVPFNIGDDAQSIRDSAGKVLASDALAVIGYHTSAAALLAGPLLESGKIVTISPSASANRVFELGPHVYSVSYSNKAQASSIANYAVSTLQAKKIAMVVANDCAYCADLAASFASEVGKHKKVSLTSYPVLEKTRDLKPVIKAVRAQNPDVVFIPNYEMASSRFISELTADGYKGRFVGGDGWNNANGAGFLQPSFNKPVEAVFVGHWDADMKTAGNAGFVSKFQKRYGTKPDVDAALGYDSMGLLLRALFESANHSRDGVQQAMQGLSSYSGVTGEIRFAAGRFASKTAPLFKVDAAKSRFEILKLLEMKSGK